MTAHADTSPADSPAGSPAASRKKMRMDGQHSLVDVARKVCGDVRIAGLLKDLNPTLPEVGMLLAGTIVVCPSKGEAAAFARKLGFTLGFDPKASNGTDKRRAWSKHQGPVSGSGKVDAVALAVSLLERNLSPAEAGKRLARQCGDVELAALAASSEGAVRQVGTHAEAHALFPRAVSRIAAVRSVLEATAKPAGLRALCDALAKDAGAVSLLTACAVAPALRQVLLDEASRVASVVAQAADIGKLERGARDAAVQGDAVLRKLVDAAVDGVEPLAGDRVAALGLEDEMQALAKHLEMMRGALKQAEDNLGRQSADVIKAIARGGDGGKLGRPWPLLCQVMRDVGTAVDAAPATARDLGLGGLWKRRTTSSEGVSVTMTVAELQVRAASCARAVDEGDAFSERLAPVIVELFGLMRPPPAVDGGTQQARKARRRAAFDQAMGGKGGVTPEGIVALALDVVDRAKLGGNAAAQRMNRGQLQSLEAVAKEMAAPALTIHRAPMSELGRALVVAAMAIDREVGQGLSRPTGREAFILAAAKHAGRVLSAASCAI